MSTPTVPHTHTCSTCGKVKPCKLKRWHPTGNRFCSSKCMIAAGYPPCYKTGSGKSFAAIPSTVTD